jgi:hypothetical protein
MKATGGSTKAVDHRIPTALALVPRHEPLDEFSGPCDDKRHGGFTDAGKMFLYFLSLRRTWCG